MKNKLEVICEIQKPTCYRCEGKGKVRNKACKTCDGTGYFVRKHYFHIVNGMCFDGDTIK